VLEAQAPAQPPRWRYIHAQHAAFHEMMGDLQRDVSDMVILLEVAQGEIVGKLRDASSLSLRLEMPRQTVVRKFAELEERDFVMKERRERRLVVYEVHPCLDADSFSVVTR
jgi:hypothetical protein